MRKLHFSYVVSIFLMPFSNSHFVNTLVEGVPFQSRIRYHSYRDAREAYITAIGQGTVFQRTRVGGAGTQVTGPIPPEQEVGADGGAAGATII